MTTGNNDQLDLDEEKRRFAFERSLRIARGEEARCSGEISQGGGTYLSEKILADLQSISRGEGITVDGGYSWGDDLFDDLPVPEYPPVKTTPYDRALRAKREAQALVERFSVDTRSEEYSIEMAALSEANRKLAEEQLRATDDLWRRKREIDEWRTENKSERNARARKVRSKSNLNLSRMTDDELKAHKKQQASDHAFASRKRKLGWSTDEISKALAERQAKRDT